jgi:hypothetical protein
VALDVDGTKVFVHNFQVHSGFLRVYYYLSQVHCHSSQVDHHSTQVHRHSTQVYRHSTQVHYHLLQVILIFHVSWCVDFVSRNEAMAEFVC